MGQVATVILMMSCAEVNDQDDYSIECCPPLVALNAWLREHVYSEKDAALAELVRVDEAFVGWKAPQTIVAGRAFNYLDVEAFVEAVQAQAWRYPDNVLLVIDGDNIQMQIERIKREPTEDERYHKQLNDVLRSHRRFADRRGSTFVEDRSGK